MDIEYSTFCFLVIPLERRPLSLVGSWAVEIAWRAGSVGAENGMQDWTVWVLFLQLGGEGVVNTLGATPALNLVGGSACSIQNIEP